MLDTVSTTAMDPVQEISASHMLTNHFDKSVSQLDLTSFLLPKLQFLLHFKFKMRRRTDYGTLSNKFIAER